MLIADAFLPFSGDFKLVYIRWGVVSFAAVHASRYFASTRHFRLAIDLDSEPDHIA